MIEPPAYVHPQAAALQIIQHGSSQAFAKPIGRASRSVVMSEVIVGKTTELWTKNPDPVCLGIESNWAVSSCGKSVPKRRLQQIGGKELPDAFQRIDCFLDGFRRESVHQIGVHQNAGFSKRRGNLRGLIDRDAFLHPFQQSVRCGFQPCRHRDTAGGGEKPTKVG